MKETEADFGYECPEYTRALIVRTLRGSEMSLRRKGKFDLAAGYQSLADAVECDYVKEWHGWEVSMLYLGVHIH